jgi:hypothetical protein
VQFLLVLDQGEKGRRLVVETVDFGVLPLQRKLCEVFPAGHPCRGVADEDVTAAGRAGMLAVGPLAAVTPGVPRAKGRGVLDRIVQEAIDRTDEFGSEPAWLLLASAKHER